MISERTTLQLKEASSARLSDSTKACCAYYVTAGQRMLGCFIQAPKTYRVANTRIEEAIHSTIELVDILPVQFRDLNQVV
jgi:hypothetical protein